MQKIIEFIRTNFSAIADVATAIVALSVALLLPSDSPEIFKWILRILALVAFTATTKRLEVFHRIWKNTSEAVEILRAMPEMPDRGSLLNNYQSLPAIQERLRGAHTIWLSGRNFSSLLGFYRDFFRQKILDEDCKIRLLVVDPDGAVVKAETIHHYGEESLSGTSSKSKEFKGRVKDIRSYLNSKSANLEVRMLDYSPRFGMMVSNPRSGDGVVQVQILSHGCDSGSRPILRIKRGDLLNQNWYIHFVNQFERQWDLATPLPH